MATTNINIVSESAATLPSGIQSSVSSSAESPSSATAEAVSTEAYVLHPESDSSIQHAVADIADATVAAVAVATDSASIVDSDTVSSSDSDDPTSTQPPPAGFLFCPADRVAIEIATLGDSHSAFHARRVAALRVRCRFHARGCGATAMPLSALDAHCGACAWRDVRCLACGRTGRCDAVAAHLRAECARAKVLAVHGDPLAEPDADADTDADADADVVAPVAVEEAAERVVSDSGNGSVIADGKVGQGSDSGSALPNESADGASLALPMVASSSSLSPRGAAAEQSQA